MVAADVHHHQRLQLRQEEEEEEEEEDFEVSSDISDDSEETPHEHEGEEEDELGDHHHHLLLQAPASKIRLKSPPPGSKVAQLKDTIEAQVDEKQKKIRSLFVIFAQILVTDIPKFAQFITSILSKKLLYKVSSILKKNLKTKVVITTAATTTSTVPWSGLRRRQKRFRQVSRVVEFSSCDPEGRTRPPRPEESTRWRTRRRRKAIGV